MKKRSGMSMAEVLVALFLMALGSIAILTMFPLGMYHMGQALKDDRTAQSASQADASMRMYWRMNVVEAGGTNEPFVFALDNPDSPVFLGPTVNPNPLRGTPSVSNSGNPGVSYPVFVDPMGFVAPWASQNSSFQRDWVAFPGNPANPPFIPRRTLNGMTAQLSQRICSLMDGFGFNENGTPSTSGGAIERELRYNWLWVIQRPDNSNRNTANMTVVVFDKRAFQYAPQNAEAVYPSGATQATTIAMVPLSTTIQIPTSQGIPAVHKGGWIMDATPGLRHAIFYRVVSVTDNPNNIMIIAGIPTVVPTTDLELQTPIHRLDGGTGAYPGTLIFMAGVSEVFERPNLTPNDY